MPYFVYRIHPPKQLHYIEELDEYRSARTRARALRPALNSGDGSIIKVIFAPNREQAEKLLTTEREPRPLGEDA